MGIILYPRQQPTPGPTPSGLSAPGFPSQPVNAEDGGDRLVVGLLAGAVLFYLFGKAIGLGRNSTED